MRAEPFVDVVDALLDGSRRVAELVVGFLPADAGVGPQGLEGLGGVQGAPPVQVVPPPLEGRADPRQPGLDRLSPATTV